MNELILEPVTAYTCPICGKINLKDLTIACYERCKARKRSAEIRSRLKYYSQYLMENIDSLDQIPEVLVEKAKEFFDVDIQINSWVTIPYVSKNRYIFREDSKSVEWLRTIRYDLHLKVPALPLWGKSKARLFHAKDSDLTWGFQGFRDCDSSMKEGRHTDVMTLDIREWPLLYKKRMEMLECKRVIDRDINDIQLLAMTHKKKVKAEVGKDQELQSLLEEELDLEVRMKKLTQRIESLRSSLLSQQPKLIFPPEPPEAEEYHKLREELHESQ